MKLNEEKLKEVRRLQQEICNNYSDKAEMIQLAKSILPEKGIIGFFIRRYKDRLDKAEETFYFAGQKVYDFKINIYNKPLTIFYENRPISTKQEFICCKQTYLEKIGNFNNYCEWLKASKRESFNNVISDFLKKLEEVFEEEASQEEAIEEE